MGSVGVTAVATAVAAAAAAAAVECSFENDTQVVDRLWVPALRCVYAHMLLYVYVNHAYRCIQCNNCCVYVYIY